MVQEIGKVRASAPRATLMKVYGRAPGKAPAGLRTLVALVIVTGISLVITASAFAAESAKPNAVATVVRPPKPVVASKLDGDKPALCPPTKPDDPKAAGSAPAAGSPKEQKKDASGSTGNDLTVQLPSHERKEKDENRVSSSANGDSGDAASGESTSLQVRLKDKDKDDIDVAPAVAPAQCTIPGASQPQEPPSPH